MNNYHLLRSSGLVLLACVLCLGDVSAAFGRVTIITGGISVKEGLDSNVDRTENEERAEWTTDISPSFELNSKGPIDSLQLRYAPAAHLNHRSNESTVNHSLNLDANRILTEQFKIRVKNKFVRTDEPAGDSDSIQQDEGGIVLADDRGKSRYWTNSFSMGTDYEYTKNSFLNLGYSNQVLENSTTTRSDYTKHNPTLSLSYHVNPRWSLGTSLGYTKGQFDLSENIDSYNGGVTYGFHGIPHHTIGTSYNLEDTSYDGATPDYTTHSLGINWQHDMNPQTSIAASVGGALASRQGEDDEKNLNLSLNFSRKFQLGTFSLSGSSGFESLQYNGNNDGLSRYRTLQSRMGYQLLQDLTAGLNASAREDSLLDQTPDEEKKSYGAGCSLTYSFKRWYALSAKYDYLNLNSSTTGASYDDHRLSFTLSYRKELTRF